MIASIVPIGQSARRIRRPSRSRLSHRRRPGGASGSLYRLVLAAAIGAIALIAGGCGEKAEPTGATVPLYPVRVTGGDGREVTLAARPERIGVAGAAALEIAQALRIRFAQVGEGSGTINPKALRELEPALVIAGSEIDPLALERVRRSGIPVYVAPARTLDQIERAITDISLLTGVALRGRELRSAMAETRLRVRNAIRGAKPVRVFFDAGGFSTVSDGSLVGDLIREAGGINVVGPDPDEGPMKAKRLIALRPEVYVSERGNPVSLAGLRHDHVLRFLPAIQSGRFIRIDPQLLRPGPKAARALYELAAFFHPDAF